jgi:hypothetical protein
MGEAKIVVIFNELYKQIWENQEDFLLVDEETGTQYIKLPDFEEEVIMVRDEYVNLWEFVCDKRALRISSQPQGKMRGLVVTGQPGIGKYA